MFLFLRYLTLTVIYIMRCEYLRSLTLSLLLIIEMTVICCVPAAGRTQVFYACGARERGVPELERSPWHGGGRYQQYPPLSPPLFPPLPPPLPLSTC